MPTPRYQQAWRSLVFRRAIVLIVLVLLGLAGSATAGIPERAPDKVLTGKVTRGDFQRYRQVPFVVPAGTQRLVVSFDYDHRAQKTAIDLGVEDPHGFRGQSGGNKTVFTISETDATPSYLTGRIDPGRWALTLAIPNIRPGVTAHWTAKIWFLKGAEAQFLLTSTRGHGPGWYRGDLHMHTAHSDGSCNSQSGQRVPCPLFLTLERAVARGLDFVAITDHNSVTQYNAMREDQPYFDRLLLIPGREITTFYGHFNIFGVTQPIDYRIAPGIDNSFGHIADKVHALGGIVSINHPALPSGEACMGCGWTMPNVDYAKVDMVEVINGGAVKAMGGNPEGPFSGIPLWLSEVSKGHRLAAIGGSDNHGSNDPGPSNIGAPETVVYASDLSLPAILKGLRQGRSFIVLDATMREIHLDFSLTAGGRSAVMGGALDAPTSQSVEMALNVSGPAGAALELLDGTRLLRSIPLTNGNADAMVGLTLAKGKHFVRLQLRAENGRLIALSNGVKISMK